MSRLSTLNSSLPCLRRWLDATSWRQPTKQRSQVKQQRLSRIRLDPTVLSCIEQLTLEGLRGIASVDQQENAAGVTGKGRAWGRSPACSPDITGCQLPFSRKRTLQRIASDGDGSRITDLHVGNARRSSGHTAGTGSIGNDTIAASDADLIFSHAGNRLD